MSRIAKRKLIIFIVILALVFYFSSSIRYWMMPKVTLSSVSTGTIVWQRRVSEIHWTSPQLEVVKTSLFLPDGISVVEGQKFQMREVVKGEKLLVLDSIALDNAIMDAREAYTRCLEYQMEYSRGLVNAQENAQEELMKAESALPKNGVNVNAKRRAQLEKAYQTAQENYDLIVTQGIYSGTTLEIVAEKTQSTQKKLEAVVALRDAGDALTAPCDGLLVSWPSEMDQGALKAKQEYFTIIPNGAHRQLMVTLEGETTCPERVNQVVLASQTNPLERYSMSIADRSVNGQDAVKLILEGDSVNERFDLNQSYLLSYESDSYQALVPNTAFVTEDTVYVLTRQYRSGRWEDVVQAVKVKREAGNAYYTPVISGVRAGDQVITSWDRPLVMGQPVIVLETEKLR